MALANSLLRPGKGGARALPVWARCGPSPIFSECLLSSVKQPFKTRNSKFPRGLEQHGPQPLVGAH